MNFLFYTISRARNFHNLSEKEQDILQKLTMGNDGSMQDEAWLSCPESPVKVWIARNPKGIPLGWTMIVNLHNSTFCCYTFVHPSFRRKGVASALFTRAANYAAKSNIVLKVYPHDRRSSEFFRKFYSNKVINYTNLSFNYDEDFNPRNEPWKDIEY